MRAPRFIRRRRALSLLRRALRLPPSTRARTILSIARLARFDAALRGDRPLGQVEQLIEEAR
jgi:hypothetical protein